MRCADREPAATFFFHLKPDSSTLPAMKIRVTILPKASVLDPQGVATADAMKHLGWTDPGRVRVGKMIEIEAPERPDEERLHAICRDLLSNPVIEDYTLEICGE